MPKILMTIFIFSLTIALNVKANAQDLPDFESELQQLENNQLQAEELQMRNVDAVTNVITDDVSTGQAGLQKGPQAETDTDETILMTKDQKERARRVRSRPL